MQKLFNAYIDLFIKLHSINNSYLVFDASWDE
jgi:hypothetical protein